MYIFLILYLAIKSNFVQFSTVIGVVGKILRIVLEAPNFRAFLKRIY